MLCQTFAGRNGVEHYHDLVVLKRFDLALPGFLHAYRVKTVGYVLREKLVTVELLEHHGEGGFLACQSLVVVLVHGDGPLAVVHAVVPAVVEINIHVDGLDLFEVVQRNR